MIPLALVEAARRAAALVSVGEGLRMTMMTWMLLLKRRTVPTPAQHTAVEAFRYMLVRWQRWWEGVQSDLL